MPTPRHDPRTSATHRPLLETPGTLAYLPHALRWSCRLEVIAFAVLFGGVLGLFAGYLVGLWIVVLVGSGAIAWLLAILARAEQGFGDPPHLGADVLLTVGLDALRVALIAGLVVGAFIVLSRTSPGAALMFAAVAGALLPACLALLAVEDSLLAALNPLRIARLTAFGGPFAWLAAGAGATGLAAALPALAAVSIDGDALSSLVGHAPSGARIALAVVSLWVLALVLHLYGHALHHRHEAVGLGALLDAADDTECEAARLESAASSAAAALERAAAAGNRVAAAVAIAVPAGVETLPFLATLWERMRVARQDAAAVFVARHLVPAALAAKRYPLAREVWLEARALSPGFDPGDDARRAFIEQAEAHGDMTTAASVTSHQ